MSKREQSGKIPVFERCLYRTFLSLMLRWESLKPRKDSRGSAQHRTRGHDLLKQTIQNQSQPREKLYKSRGNQVQPSKGLLPTEPQRMHLIPPAPNCDNMCEMSNQGSSLETQCPKVFIRVTYTASAWHTPKCQILRRKGGARHEPYCLCKYFKHSKPLLSVIKWWEHSQNSIFFSDAGQGPTL